MAPHVPTPGMKPKSIPATLSSVFIALSALSSQAATFDIPLGNTTDQTSNLAGSENITKQGAGTLRVAVNQTFTGPIDQTAGTTILYGNGTPSAINVSSGTLMLGGNVNSSPINLSGGTLRIGAQRTIPWTSITDGRRVIATQGGNADFVFAGTAAFYTRGRATAASQSQAIIDLGIPESGLATSLADPSLAFQFRIQSTDVNASRVNSHEGGANGTNTKYISIPAASQMKYAQVQTLLATSAGTGMQFAGYARYSDAPTLGSAVGASGVIPLYTATSTTSTLAVGSFDRVQTYSAGPLHFFDHKYSVNPEKTLTSFGLLRSGGNTANTGGYFALSGLAVNEASFTSPLTVTGASTLDLAGAPATSSEARIAAASLALNNATLTTTRTISNTVAHRVTFTQATLAGTSQIDVANSTGGGAGHVVITGPITGSGGLSKSGAGNLGLNGDNSYEGPTTIQSGTVSLNSATGLGSSNAGTTITGGTLHLLNGAQTATISEPLTVTAAATLRAGDALAYSLNGETSLSANLVVNTDEGASISHGGAISGTGSITKQGPGTLILSGTNSFGSGTFTLGNSSENRGYIQLASSTALGNHTLVNLPSTQTSGVGGLQLAGGVTFSQPITTAGRGSADTNGYILRSVSGSNTWNGNITFNVGGGGYGILADAGSTLTIGGNITSTVTGATTSRGLIFGGNGDIAVNGNITRGTGADGSQNITLTKSGSGTLTLGGTNNYSGTTTVEAGTLALTGSIAATPSLTLRGGTSLDVSSHGTEGYSFGASQTLRGAGTIIGNTRSSGILAPGFSAGTLNFNGNLTLNEAGSYQAELDIAGTPQVETGTATGTTTADGNVVVTVTGSEITGSPVTLEVPVLLGDTASDWAAKVRSALAQNAAITGLYAVGGSAGSVTLTRSASVTNDTALNIALANGTTSPGITAAATSANTTAGIAPGIDRLAVSGQLTIAEGAFLNLVINGTPTAPAYVIATYGSRSGTFANANILNLPAGYEVDYQYQSGTAIAIVQSAPATQNFASWATQNSVTGGPGGDSDVDGITNLMEYALNLNPAGPDSSVGTFSGNSLSFSKRAVAVANDDVIYQIETSPNLQPPWTPVLTPDVDNATTISHTLPAGQTKIFGRLKVSQK